MAASGRSRRSAALLRLQSAPPPTEPRSRTEEDALQLSLRLAQQMGDLSGEARSLVALAREARKRRDFRVAAELLGQANALSERLGSLSGQADVRLQQSMLSMRRARRRRPGLS